MSRTNTALATTAEMLLALIARETQQLLLLHDVSDLTSFQGSMLHCIVSCSNAGTLFSKLHDCHDADTCPSATAAASVSAVTLLCLLSLSC